MPLSVPSKNTGDQLTAAEFNELLAKVNEYDDRSWTSADLADFDTEVSNNTDVVANTAKISYTDGAAVTANTAKISFDAASSAKVGFLSVTQAVDLDTMESNITTNNAKVSYTDGAQVSTNTSDISTIQGEQTTQDAAIALNTAKTGVSGSELEATDINTLLKVNTIIADATLIDTADSRLSDARTPTSHTHVEADITDLGSYLESVGVGDLTATGTPDGTTFLRGDGTWAAPAGSGDMVSTNNLSDVASAATSRTNLGLAIGTNVQAWSAVLDATTASFLTADETKLDGIATGATADQTSIVGIGGTKAQFNTELSDGSFLFVGDAPTSHTHVVADITDFPTIPTVDDTAYNATTWDGNTDAPTKNAVRDKFESLTAGGISNVVEDTTPQLGGNLDLNTFVITGLEIGTNVQAYSAVLDGTTASFTTADETKLDAIEASATADQTSIVGITGTKAQFNTELSDGTFMYVGDAPTSHTHLIANITDFTDNSTNWDTGYAWGDHSVAGYGDVSADGTPTDGKITVWSGANTVKALNHTLDANKLYMNVDREGQWQRVLDILSPNMVLYDNLQMYIGQSATAGNGAEWNFNYWGNDAANNKAILGLFGKSFLEFHNDNKLVFPEANIKATGSHPEDVSYAGLQLEGDGTKPAKFTINVAQSADGTPAIFGMDNYTSGNAVRWQFGDAWNVIENMYGQGMAFMSYHTMVFDGSSGNSSTPIGWTGTRYTAVAGEAYRFIVNSSKKIVFRKRTVTARSAPWLEIQDENGANPVTIIDVDGKIPFAQLLGVQAQSAVLDATTASFTTADETKLDGIATGATANTGTVDTSGTPVALDFARFTDADTIEGRSYAEVRADLGLEIGTDVQAYSSVLNATTASFLTADETKLDGIEALAEVNIVAQTDTPTTVLTLDNPMGRYSNMGTANTNSTFTTTGTTNGAWCKVLINNATRPTVTGGTLITSPAHEVSTNMYLMVEYVPTRGVEYWFVSI